MKKCYKGLQIYTKYTNLNVNEQMLLRFANIQKKNTNLNVNKQMLQRFANIQKKTTNLNVNEEMLPLRFATMEEKVLVSSVLRKFNLR